MKRPGVLLVSAALALGLTGCGQGTPNAPMPAAVHPSIPAGFTDLHSDGLAVSKVDTVGEPCDFDLGSCYQVLVYAEQDCDVYLEANGLDASGTVIAMTNDTANLSAGDTARMTLQFTQQVDSLKVTDIHCA